MERNGNISTEVFTWKSSTIFYRSWGRGSELMIAFHGYGLDGKSFYPITESLSDRYRIVAVDLPHQGRTRWREPGALDQKSLCDLIHAFVNHLNYTGKITLLAYSIGGNYALGFAQRSPEMIHKIVLIAADGLKFKPLFWFITRTWLGRMLFQGFVVAPQPVFWMIRWGRRLNIYPPRVLTFFYESIASKTKRTALMKRWISVSRILPKQKSVASTLNKHAIKVGLLFGQRDHVIPVDNARKFASKIKLSMLITPDQGHQLLTSHNAPLLEQLLDF